jgi:hypothetical protein
MVPISSKAYWLLLGEKMIHGAAIGALGAKASTEVTDITTVGWKTMLAGAAFGALYALLQGLGSDAVPGTLNQSLLPATPKLRRAAATVHRRRSSKQHRAHVHVDVAGQPDSANPPDTGRGG